MEENRNMKKINLKAISELTGYSPATVSNALNHKKGVRKDTSLEIHRVAKELGYISEDTITRLRLIIYKKNGLIIDNTPFFSLVLDGVEEECRKQGLEILLSHLNQADPDYLRQAKWMLGDDTAAVIVLGTELTDKDAELYKKSHCPLLTLDYWCGDMSLNGITIDNMDSAQLAVEYLISKGHKEIGYLRGSFRIKAFHERAAGYRMALRQAGLQIDSRFVITLPPAIDDAEAAMRRYLAEKRPLPSAFFADNDMIALGAMRALEKEGYQIPGDVSVIGFDDLPFSEISAPPLTTIRVPKREMGRLAVRRLTEMLRDGSGVKTRTQVCTSFIERKSVKEIV